jgi:hypothetical protein
MLTALKYTEEILYKWERDRLEDVAVNERIILECI